MAKKKTAKKQRTEDLPGISLEKAVAPVQQMMDKDSVVTHNETLADRLGNKRQFDVVIRGTFAGKDMLGVIECKDHKHRKGPADVEAFAKKSEHLGANLRMMVSRKGFTKQALVLANHEFISCYSLISNEFHNGLNFGQFFYGIIGRWENVGIRYGFTTATPLGFGNGDILWKKMAVCFWFLTELFDKHSANDPGTYRFSVRFPQTLVVECLGVECGLKEMVYVGALTHTKKRLWIAWQGEAVFDWAKGHLCVPPDASLYAAIAVNMNTWEDYEGEIPNSPEKGGLLIVGRGSQHLPEGTPIPDLSSVNPIFELVLV